MENIEIAGGMKVVEFHYCKYSSDYKIYKVKDGNYEPIWAVGDLTYYNDVLDIKNCPFCNKDFYEEETEKAELEKIERKNRKKKYYKKKSEDAFEKFKAFKFPDRNEKFVPKALWWYAVTSYYIGKV